jgi:hypothetical protein
MWHRILNTLNTYQSLILFNFNEFHKVQLPFFNVLLSVKWVLFLLPTDVFDTKNKQVIICPIFFLDIQVQISTDTQ